MAWNPNIPTVTNRVQDDLDAIRENFQHLDQLAERVDELQTVSELAPIANDLQNVSGLAPVVEELQAVSGLASITDELQTVSGLAPVANDLQAVSGLAQAVDELQTVSELAPYVQAILYSRIVEMGSNANGEYVRWENGLQVCFGRTGLIVFIPYGSGPAATVTFPAAFISPPIVSMVGARDDTNFASHYHLELGLFVTATGFQVLYSNNHAAELSRRVLWIAIGAWK